MTIKKFFIFLGMILVVALVVYVFTTPHGSEIELTGVVTGNDVIVSPLVQGRLEKLLVDEGSEVKAGQLIAEIDPTELKTVRDAAAANIRTMEARLNQSSTTRSMNDAQTSSSVAAAQATLTAARAQLEQAQATLSLNDVTYKRDQGLFEKGVVAAQDRDTAEANLRASQASVRALEDQVKAAQAQLDVAQANRKQVDVGTQDIAATRAQIAQATAQRAQAETQLGYTKIVAPTSGIVSVRVARQGEVVQPGGPIVTIIDIDHLWVQADVEESLIDSIQFNQKLKVRLPSGDELEGTVFFKGVENDFATQRDVSRTKRDIKTFSIKVSVPNPERRLFAGMTATVLLPPRKTSAGWFHLPGTIFAFFSGLSSRALSRDLLFFWLRESRP
jgi:HlyD family secretion protein